MLSTSGLVNDVMFSCNGLNRQESKAARMFRRVRQVETTVGGQMTLFGRVRQVAEPWAKSAIPDCILLKLIWS